ncbi:MAG: NAD(P)-dependent oxidoreductase [Gammaproteobacteria bacterium]|nr:MAG: NAD(P)-dependent oxidoreductase [Gammaproteobacteria bacterium]
MKKTALITGASSGFGEATARILAANNWLLILVARRTEKLRSLADELGESVIECISLDVREREDVKQKLEPWNGKVSLLVNNAGLAVGLDNAWEANLDDWDAMVDTNIKGLTYVTRALLSGMVQQGQGHVINLGSIAGSYTYPGSNAYGASKAFVERFSINLRADLHGTGVRVTNIEPGLAETEFSKVRFKGDSKKADSVYQGTQPLQPNDIAESILWCANLPQHVNINRLEIMPTGQSFGPLAVVREQSN